MEEVKNISWLGHASFSFVDKTSGQRIYYVDPFDLHQSNLPKADLLFVTHAHPDHLSPNDITNLLKPQTVVIAPPNCLDKLALKPNQQFPVEPNKSYILNNFSFQTVPAYNMKEERSNFHPKENNWVGYIFNLNDKKIYHAGDTDIIPEMDQLAALHLDVALLPMGGTYTMDAYEAAQAANVIKAKITIPMHYRRLLGDKHAEGEEQFKKEVINSHVVILDEMK